MSNTSYSFKENSHMKVIQGGEKKVMKKILSVALSTAMAFSMFASVAFGADAKLSPEQQFNVLKDAGIVTGYPDQTAGLDKSITRAELAKVIVKSINLEPVTGVATYKDKNYTASHWAAPFIEAATQAGILEGKNLEKKLFDPTGNVTVQELAKVLVAALKLEVPAETNNTATEWAKGYVEAAVKAGYLEAGINYQANATRAQAVVAAYAIYEANQVPTVASYEVSEAGKVVEFTLSNKEVVKVTLEKALEANKETEVKFTQNGHDYTHKVIWKVDTAQKVDSVSASNLKEIVVVFDGTVDKKSAGNKNNYEVKDQTVDSVSLSSDNKTATVLLEETSTLTNQKETEVKVKNVQNFDKSKTIEQTVKFTPVDVKIPEIKEIVGLGTSAFKVVFSEPVLKSDVYASSNYKVDGVTVGGFVEYSYPNVAIINVTLPKGDHKLTVSNVRDYSGLKIAPVEQSFTIAEDTSAPEVVSIKSNDLRELEIEFNETIKSVEKVYHNVSGNSGKITKRDNKLVVTFTQPLNLSENTVYIEGVTDYSGNKANREAKVNPTLDIERPTVTKVSADQADTTGYHELTVEYSKKVTTDSAEKKANYTIKDKNGKVVSANGLDKDGHPFLTPKYDTDKNKVTVYLGSKLDAGDYTLEVAGVVDTAYVANTMLPYKATFTAKQTVGDAIARAWSKKDGNETVVYVQFKTAVKTSGDGAANIGEKYQINGKSLKDFDIDFVAGDTIRLKSTKNSLNLDAGNNPITATLIQDIDGNYLKSSSGSYTLTKDISSYNFIKIESVKATTREEVKIKLEGKLSSAVLSDFYVKAQGLNDSERNYYPSSAELSADQTTVTLKFEDSNKLPAHLIGAKFFVVANPSSRDAQGTPIQTYLDTAGNVVGTPLKDEIKPDLNERFTVSAGVAKTDTATSATYYEYTVTLNGNDNIVVANANVAESIVKVKIDGDAKTTTSVTSNGGSVLTVVFRSEAQITNSQAVRVALNGASNQELKAIIDNTADKNAYADYDQGGIYQNLR
ncbi:S-layer homology domain-containing protein [Paenibacillus anaericanus]|uniref:S-layer homology domain-containing protein n=1 Tax=Paenibacillus anaericanus TaxID=170367 RepID=A0A433Y4C9_9BACL|nr:S-layer homology domain-containing protein [Paenibacillus anaericanus]RUT42967.1 S-layer homology domain-containing protein [Paenibacillus anaericanus]